MKRLTDKRLALPPGVWQEVTHEKAWELKEIPVPSMRELYYRLSQFEDIMGDEYDLDRLRELAEADREGRCVVLPCKIGDIVYEIRYTAENDRPRKHARKRFDHSVSGCTWRMREQPEMCYVSEKKCTKSDFEFMGRTVFLTREEAEAALAKLNSET